MKINLQIILAVVILLMPRSILSAELTILTENLPPLNFIKDDVLMGPAVDIVKEIQRRVGSFEKIRVYPWARAYKIALEEANIVIFGMARTEARNDKFYWIGPIAEKRDILAAKKNSGLKINSLEDAKKVDHIGTLRNDVKEIFLQRHGFTNLVSTHNDQNNVKKLLLGRIDLWATKIPGLKTICQLAGADCREIVEVYDMRKSAIYIAISKKTSEITVQSWANAFNDMAKDGTILTIKAHWNKIMDDDPFPESK
jgi:polar amino acid transport system substrate-binding protein